jgi:hypothetical protein
MAIEAGSLISKFLGQKMNPSHSRNWYCVPKTPIRSCTTKVGHNNSLESVCIDLIGAYTLKGKDGTNIDFMCLTMIDPASSWFKLLDQIDCSHNEQGKNGIMQ